MSFEPGTLFANDYRVVKPLNQGGMGAVFVVQQLSTGKLRALKLMNSSLVFDPVSRAKFEQEARIGARIASEHVVEVVAAGVDPQTQVPFLVMELLEGEDMATRLKRGPFQPAEAAPVLEQVAHALGAAHDANVVHRDLKPENVFLGVSKRSTAGLVVKLLDFGIAKVTEDHTKNTTAAYGTPMWLAPEQTRRGEITPAADVWAFGLLAFTMLTGHAFWRHAEGPQASLPSLIQDITTDPIPAASSRAIEFAMHLPPHFDAWLHTALQRDPRMRFSNVRLAWQALAPILKAQPVAATVMELAPAKKSNGAAIALVVVLALVVLGMAGAGIALFMMRSKEPAPVAATPPPTSTTTIAATHDVVPPVAPSSTTTTSSPSVPVVVAATTPLPVLVEGEHRIGGGAFSNNTVLMGDAARQFNGALSTELDKCLPPRTGERMAHSQIIVKVAPNGSVTSATPAMMSAAGPVAQCLADTISRAHFVATKSGGELMFQLTWLHP
jgi:tRNA A-37 threonylcarbamoyl transferase component Bud32